MLRLINVKPLQKFSTNSICWEFKNFCIK